MWASTSPRGHSGLARDGDPRDSAIFGCRGAPRLRICVLGVGGRGGGRVTSRMARGPFPVLRAEIKPQQMSAHNV
jgi:hypothetical protein